MRFVDYLGFSTLGREQLAGPGAPLGQEPVGTTSALGTNVAKQNTATGLPSILESLVSGSSPKSLEAIASDPMGDQWGRGLASFLGSYQRANERGKNEAATNALLQQVMPGASEETRAAAARGLTPQDVAEYLLTSQQPKEPTTEVEKVLRARESAPEGSHERAVLDARLNKLTAEDKGTTINVDTNGSQKFFEKLGTNTADEVKGIREGANTAREALSDVKRFRTSMEKFKTGVGADSKIIMGKVAQLAGFDFDVSAGEDIASVANKFALGFKEKLPGVLSDNDIVLLKSLAPQLGSSLEANERFLNIIEKSAQGKIELNNSVTQFMREAGEDIKSTDLQAFIDETKGKQLGSELEYIDFISQSKEDQELQRRQKLRQRMEELEAKERGEQ